MHALCKYCRILKLQRLCSKMQHSHVQMHVRQSCCQATAPVQPCCCCCNMFSTHRSRCCPFSRQPQRLNHIHTPLGPQANYVPSVAVGLTTPWASLAVKQATQLGIIVLQVRNAKRCSQENAALMRNAERCSLEKAEAVRNAEQYSHIIAELQRNAAKRRQRWMSTLSIRETLIDVSGCLHCALAACCVVARTALNVTGPCNI
jgi:hypothetical protein